MTSPSAASTPGAASPHAERTSVDARDSFELWHEVTCRNYSHSELRRDCEGAFGARISMRPFGALALSDVSSTRGEAQLIRRQADIRRDGREHFMLFHVTKGEIGVAQDGREARAQAGDLFLYDQTRPFTLDFGPRYRAWMLSIPRPMLEIRVRRTRGVAALRIAGTSRLGAFVGSIVGQLDGFGVDAAAGVIDRIGAAALDVVATAIETAIETEPGADLPDRAAQHRLLAGAQAFMRANLQAPGLDIETIAGALRTSPRTLNRAFASDGTTPIRWLWRQRLAACNRALADGRAASVTEAALSFGFNDLSHFSRAFKKAFGRSPRTLLRRSEPAA